MPVRSVITPAIALAIALTSMLPTPASAVASPADSRVFANCTAVHAVYSGGIARKGVSANRTPSGARALKGKVRFDTALYLANRKSDRDGDGIACELS